MAASQRSPESIMGGTEGRTLLDNGSTGQWANTYFDFFTGDGTEDTFTLSNAPVEGHVEYVTVDGIVSAPMIGVTPHDYEVVSGDIVFTGPVALNSPILVRYKSFA